MNPRELKLYSTMIWTLKYDSENYNDVDELLTILSYSEIELLSSGVFANKPGHFREDVNIRVKIPLLTKARNLQQSFRPLIFDCYSEDNRYELDDINIKPKQISSLDDLEIRSNQAIFSKIRDEIIQSIRMAKHSIWISIAWFTDEALYQELYNQQTKGVHIRILISNEQQNQSMIPKLKEKFETIVVNKWGYNGFNRLHSKYCIIDNSIVLQGSFNWTPTASQNEEHLTVSVDRQLAEQYTENFKEIFRNNA
ncbi:phospholipase D-like domain-containing protein [Bacillus cereus]|uniref:phospholipase D-like domain-containing protein n=1 Tax=Bacillus cereus TaxID=1396 RepID=UPI0025A2C703|nr:phospholipase D-like domain-containing protein [Bacillus cereus]MDM5235258.1 phospholipase D-like domain-containing protein [Bacillus cereus]